MSFSLFNDRRVVHMLADGSTYAVAGGTADVTSNTIDALGNGARVDILLQYGDNADTAVLGIKLQESATGLGNWVDVVTSSTLAAGATDTDNEMLGISGKLTKRYFRTIIDRGVANSVIAGLWAFIDAREVSFDQSTAAGQFVEAPTVSN